MLAVAAPIGLAVTDGIGTDPSNPPVAGPSTTPSESTPSGPRRIALTIDVEESSGAPAIPYQYDGNLLLPDGTEVPVDEDYRSFAPAGDGWVAVRADDEANLFVDVLDSAGEVLVSAPSTGSLAASADGTIAVYATPDGELMAVTAGGERTSLVDPAGLPDGTLEPVAVNGSGSCDPESADGGCVVFFNSEDGEEQGAWSATSKGIVQPLPDFLWLTGLSPDGSPSGVVSVAEDTSTCSAVGRDWDKVAWETCDHMVGRLSPDGRYVIGRPVVGDGIGDSSVAILDARTGDLLAQATNSEEHPAFINDAVWDTDNSVLMTVFEKDTWSLLRMTPDGELTEVLGDLGDDMDDVPVVLATQP